VSFTFQTSSTYLINLNTHAILKVSAEVWMRYEFFWDVRIASNSRIITDTSSEVHM
jgi:hypothetical protein